MKRTPLKRVTPLKSSKGINKIGKMRNPIPPAQRARIWLRANGKCEGTVIKDGIQQRCGSKVGLQINHYPSKKMGGTTHIYTDDELTLLCLKCHYEGKHGEGITLDTNPQWSYKEL